METREIAIKIQGVKKRYKLGQIGGGTLYGDLQSWWARVRGKEDPNSKIGIDTRSYGKTFMALNGVDMTVYKGEALGIIGHNGAGKSTLLKLLSRITAPTEGEIGINGRIASMLEVGTGFNPVLTGRENIYMNGAILGMSKAEIDAKIEEIIDFSEVREFIDTPVKRYSSGMYVKLAFSVAAHLDSEIMIMDEVLAVGDMAFQKKCLNKMREAATKAGRTVLYVSHNMNTIRQLCDRCVVLSEGKVIFDGDVEEAIDIYINNISNKSNNVDIDLSGLEHMNTPDEDIKVKMLKFEYLGKQSNQFVCGEKMRIKLTWKSLADLEGVRFKMIVRCDNDAAVGMVTSPKIINSAAGEEYTTIFEFDTSLLAEGGYFMSLTLYQDGSAGNYILLDHVTRAVSFDIVRNPEETVYLNWARNYWGAVKFPELKIADEE